MLWVGESLRGRPRTTGVGGRQKREIQRPPGAGGNTRGGGRISVTTVVLLIQLVTASRAFLGLLGALVEAWSPIGASPQTTLATDAFGVVDGHDSSIGALVLF